MAPTKASKKQPDPFADAEDVQAEQENLDPKAIFKDMEKNVSESAIDRRPRPRRIPRCHLLAELTLPDQGS